MELQTLDQQLKLAIQNHQILVGKMKADPQNGVLQKQLHDLQSHIRTLSERQKHVVQQLRKDLEIKQAHVVVSSNAVSSTSLSNHSPNLIKSLPQTAPLSLTTKRADTGRPPAPKPITVSTALLLPSKASVVAATPPAPIQQTPTAAATTNGNNTEAGRTPLAPVLASTVTINANNHHHHHHHHQVSLAPTAIFHFTATDPGPARPSQAPIRVPQYHAPRPSSASSTHNATTNNCCQLRQSPTTANTPADEPMLVRSSPQPAITNASAAATSSSFSSPAVVPAATTESSPAIAKGLPPHSTPSPPPTSATTPPADPVKSTPPPPIIDPVKTNFMAALGLITHDMVSELRNRRTERKRRTTANPQFSYGNWDLSERKIMTNKYLSNSLPPGFKRPRGRPRLGSTTPTGSRPSTPEDYEQNGGLSNGLPCLSSKHNGMPTQKENEDTCIVCRRPGDLLSCEACFESYHVRCVEEPGSDDTKIRLKLESPWICPRCLNAKDKSRSLWPKSLALVHKFILQKSAREEEKRRLQKRCFELEAEHSDLEHKAKQLNESLSSQRSKRTELVAKTKATLESIDELKKVIRVLQAS